MLLSRKVKERIGAAIGALAFLLAFGGVGAGAFYVIGATIRDGVQAQDWVRVPAQVFTYDGSSVQYRYRVADSDYIGGKVGLGWPESSMDHQLRERLNAALGAEKSITVSVSPDDPTKSVVDPRIPWTVLAILAPLALGFGAVGVGATYVFFHILFGFAQQDQQKERRPDPGEAPVLETSFLGDVGRFWSFGFFWNLGAFYAAATWVPHFVDGGQWLGLLVLIPPALGLLALWVCIRRTWHAIRRGPASLVLLAPAPRMGRPMSGYVAFPRGVSQGDRFRVRLAANWAPRRKDTNSFGNWSIAFKTEAIAAAEGLRVNFYFDVPGRVPNASNDEQDLLRWRLELFFGRQAQEAAYSFDLEIAPPVEFSGDRAAFGEGRFSSRGMS